METDEIGLRPAQVPPRPGSGEAAGCANLRLEQLWNEVTKRWERDNDTELYPTERLVWDEIGMAIAEAVRKLKADPLPRPRRNRPFVRGDWVMGSLLGLH